MKRITAAVLFIFLTGYSVSAYPEEEQKKTYNNYVGLQASSISGMGLSYGYIFLQDYMFKVSGLYVETRDLVKNPADPNDEDYLIDLWWNAGADLQKNFFKAPLGGWEIQGFGLAGGSYIYTKNKDPYSPENNDKSRGWTTGIALGLRAVFFERLSLDISFGYQYKFDIDDSERYTGIAGGAGLYFLF